MKTETPEAVNAAWESYIERGLPDDTGGRFTATEIFTKRLNAAKAGQPWHGYDSMIVTPQAYAQSNAYRETEARHEQRRHLTAEVRHPPTPTALPMIYGIADFIGAKSHCRAAWDLHRAKMITRPGAYADAIRRGGIRCLWSHDESVVYGSTEDRLFLRETDEGLIVSLDPRGDGAAELVQRIRRDDIGMSFGWDAGASDYQIRVVHGERIAVYSRVALSEVSFTATPQESATVAITADDLRRRSPKQLANDALAGGWPSKARARKALHDMFVG